MSHAVPFRFCLSFSEQEDCIRWYEELMHRTYTSLLHFGNGQEFFPQNGPIVLAGFDADVKE